MLYWNKTQTKNVGNEKVETNIFAVQGESLMAQLIHEIEWSEPILPAVKDPEWEAFVKSEMGVIPDLMTRVSRSLWLRNACLKWERSPVKEMPSRLVAIGALVTAQENACRYCYGTARAQMKVFGYSEKMISQIEREMQLAELDEKDRGFIQFCRNLARSNPRPAKADREKLIRLGFSPLAVAEMAFLIANHCFYNRVATFIACTPMHRFEKMANSFLGRILRPLIARKIRSHALSKVDPAAVETKSFTSIVRELSGLPAAELLNEALEGVFSSTVLTTEVKILMFAVVARSLGCSFCQAETRNMFTAQGFMEEEFDVCLSSLTSPRLSAQEGKILAWTRQTVHFKTGTIQKQTRALARELDEVVLLEAIGVAALANSIVRLAMLME
jgi:alkylhydroperoxidase family enzyme